MVGKVIDSKEDRATIAGELIAGGKGVCDEQVDFRGCERGSSGVSPLVIPGQRNEGVGGCKPPLRLSAIEVGWYN